jgi:ABC-type Fe3+/spermidine/putrescine transport system ATPase subunit
MRLENIHVTFDARGIAGLRGIDLALRPGEIFAIMGPSGAGKTTLLRVLAGEQSHEGRGPDVRRVSFMRGAGDLPVSEQTVLQLLTAAITRPLSDEQKLQAARDLADVFEFTFQLKHPPRDLSEGQRQRVRLALALVDHPELLLLDEPFAHLDAPLRETLLTMLHTHLKRGDTTTVWVTHHLDDALPWADRLGVMNFGRWEQVGTPAELFWRPRTLVVAQLLGHTNLHTITRTATDLPWQTSFGHWNSDGVGTDKTQLVLSLPAHAFQLGPGPWRGEVRSTNFHGHLSTARVQVGEREWLMRWNGQALANARVGEIIEFSVDLSTGVGIDCL